MCVCDLFVITHAHHLLFFSRSNASSADKDSLLTADRTLANDSDLDVEESLPSLDDVIPKDVLRKMKPKEKKLHEVINGNCPLLLSL